MRKKHRITELEGENANLLAMNREANGVIDRLMDALDTERYGCPSEGMVGRLITTKDALHVQAGEPIPSRKDMVREVPNVEPEPDPTDPGPTPPEDLEPINASTLTWADYDTVAAACNYIALCANQLRDDRRIYEARALEDLREHLKALLDTAWMGPR